jgi:predicted DNA-binding ribbon-helix-helix protein
MQSTVVKRSIVINGRRTSIRLELGFWAAFRTIAAERKLSPSELATEVNNKHKPGNLSSAIRVYILQYYRTGAN